MTRQGSVSMTRIRLLLRKSFAATRVAFGTLACWLALPTNVWAQDPSADATSKSFANQYIIVLGLIGLALFVVCKPAKRADKPKRTM